MGGGEVKVKVKTVPLQLRVPIGLNDDMALRIRKDGRWSGRQAYALEAIKEKNEREAKRGETA